MLDRAIYLTVYAHERYWVSVWDHDRNRNRHCVLHNELPKVYMLHNFYKKYESQLQEFEGYANWEAVIRVLGCPITHNGTLGLFFSWEDRCNRVRRCFTDLKKKRKKRQRRYWMPHIGGKWQKKWEPTPELAEEKRRAREHKQEWRDKLGKDRDLGKRFSRGPRRFYKEARSRTHRAWTKHHLRNGSWDSLYQHDRELFFDWRIWS